MDIYKKHDKFRIEYLNLSNAGASINDDLLKFLVREFIGDLCRAYNLDFTTTMKRIYKLGHRGIYLESANFMDGWNFL